MAGAMRGAGGVGSDTLTYSMPGLAFPSEADFRTFREQAVRAIRQNVGRLIEPCLRESPEKNVETYVNFVRVDFQPAVRSGEGVPAVVMDIELAKIKPDKLHPPFVVNIPMPTPESIKRAEAQEKLANALSLRHFKQISPEIQRIMKRPRTNNGTYNDVWVVEDSVYLKGKLRESPSPEDIHEYNKENMIKFVYTCYMYSICNFFVSIDNPPVYNFIAEPRGFFRTIENSTAVIKVENVGMDLATFLQQKSSGDMVDHSLIAEVLLQVNLVLYYAFVLLNLVHGDLHKANICVKEGRCTMLVPGTRDRLEFSHKVYLIDFDWACFKSRGRRDIFPDAATKFFLEYKCVKFNQDFLLVNTENPPKFTKILNDTKSAMKRAYYRNRGDVMAKYKYKNVRHVNYLNVLFNWLKQKFRKANTPPLGNRMNLFTQYFGHFFFSIPERYFETNKEVWTAYLTLRRYSDVLGFYITSLNSPEEAEAGGKRQRESQELQEKRAKTTAQALLTQAFSGLTF